MIIVQTPFRISLFGGGTDFPDYFCAEGGAVLSTAINKYMHVVIKDRFDEKLRISYTRTEIVDRVDEIAHELIREALRKTGIKKGVEIITMADIPAGSGLGSSSAVTVGSLHAMYCYTNEFVSSEQLARQACEIEIDILGKPIGIQDQYICALGGFRLFEFATDGTVSSTPIHLDRCSQRKLNENLLLFFTGITRQANDILGEQRNNIHSKLPLLRKMKEMAHIAKDELIHGNVDILGPLLHESWQLKKQLASKISNNGIEKWYQAALDAGATGGKITGAGGGGFLLLYCPHEKADNVRAALNQMRELPFELEPNGSKVIFNYQG
jgi:D-glycero-alpha-D-manno-heptose-7-phosphate kinase